LRGGQWPRLNDPRVAGFGRPLLIRSIELIGELASEPGRVAKDPERLSLLQAQPLEFWPPERIYRVIEVEAVNVAADP
jgi:hypothetical protein